MTNQMENFVIFLYNYSYYQTWHIYTVKQSNSKNHFKWISQNALNNFFLPGQEAMVSLFSIDQSWLFHCVDKQNYFQTRQVTGESQSFHMKVPKLNKLLLKTKT